MVEVGDGEAEAEAEADRDRVAERSTQVMLGSVAAPHRLPTGAKRLSAQRGCQRSATGSALTGVADFHPHPPFPPPCLQLTHTHQNDCHD